MPDLGRADTAAEHEKADTAAAAAALSGADQQKALREPVSGRTLPHWWNVPNQVTAVRMVLSIVVFI